MDPQAFGAGREAIRLALEDENIESRPLWKPMHLQAGLPGLRGPTLPRPLPLREGSVAEALLSAFCPLPSGPLTPALGHGHDGGEPGPGFSVSLRRELSRTLSRTAAGVVRSFYH